MPSTALHTDPQLRKKIRWIQVAVWIIFYVFLTLYTLQKWDQPEFGIWAAAIATFFYLAAVYLNASWLLPQFYQKGKKLAYFTIAGITLAVLVLLRMQIEYIILLPLHQAFYSWTLPHFSFVLITIFLSFAFGALLRVSIDYLTLLKKQEEMRTQQARTELSLLKAQVQPHFLFNTLNNIYYLAYTKNDRTAEVISKLSGIMRYFVDEAPKEKLPLSTEISFIRDYIELEQIRMLHPAHITFEAEGIDTSRLIPPMLFIPLVENIFKHGMDKTRSDNRATVIFTETDGWLQLEVINTTSAEAGPKNNSSGLNNLRKRLDMLFDGNYQLITRAQPGNFSAIIKIPL